MVKIADLLAIFKQDAIALPIKTVCKHYFAGRPFRDIVDAIFCSDFVANAQADLALVWIGECVWLPNRHCTILTDQNHFHTNQLSLSCTAPGDEIGGCVV